MRTEPVASIKKERVQRRILDDSKQLSDFIESHWELWRARDSEPGFNRLLRATAAKAGIIDRRGGTPSERTIGRAWAAFKITLEARREREGAFAAAENAWRADISVQPSWVPRAAGRPAAAPPIRPATREGAAPSARRTDQPASLTDDAHIRRLILKNAGAALDDD